MSLQAATFKANRREIQCVCVCVCVCDTVATVVRISKRSILVQKWILWRNVAVCKDCKGTISDIVFWATITHTHTQAFAFVKWVPQTKNSISQKKKKKCNMSIISSFCVENKKTCFLKILKKWTYTVFRCGLTIGDRQPDLSPIDFHLFNLISQKVIKAY